MQNRENDIVLFMDENIQLEVPVSQDGESVWLSANQMAVLFDILSFASHGRDIYYFGMI